MKKWWGLIIIGIALIAIVLISFYVIRSNKKGAIIREINVYDYNLLICLSDCPTQLDQHNNSRISKECLDKCSTSLGKRPIYKLMEYKNEEFDLLINSKEAFSCLSIYVTEGDGEKYKICLKETLPLLKEKYNIPD